MPTERPEPELFRFVAGRAPLLVTIPHAGTHVPAAFAARMTAAGAALPDTDWHVDRLYDFLDEVGASVLIATHARSVIDLNRPPDGSNLYPGRPTPELVPLRTFAGEPIWREGEAPDAAEVEARLQRYWRPFHARLAAALDELRARHGRAYLWDAHSIRAEVPRLFEGRLPDLNLGTAGGTTCAPELATRLLAIARGSKFSAVLNGRFQGGYIVRRYGDPPRGVHAVQLELAQATHLDEDAPRLCDERAARLRPVLRQLVSAFSAL